MRNRDYSGVGILMKERGKTEKQKRTFPNEVAGLVVTSCTLYGPNNYVPPACESRIHDAGASGRESYAPSPGRNRLYSHGVMFNKTVAYQKEESLLSNISREHSQ